MSPEEALKLIRSDAVYINRIETDRDMDGNLRRVRIDAVVVLPFAAHLVDLRLVVGDAGEVSA
jgi:hypothetical protein